MVFSSLTFLLFFLPAVFIVYYLIPVRFRTARNLWLLAVSLFFYGMGGLRFLPLLLFVVLKDYLCGLLAAGNSRFRKLGVALAAVSSVFLLGYYKYAGLFTGTLSSFGLPIPVLEVILPVGISFFAFQGLSYVIDVYRTPSLVQKNPLYVALYVSFFPQLVAGPIVRYDAVAADIHTRKETISEISAGLTRFCFGFGKKMLLSNAMGEITDAIWGYGSAFLPTSLAWLGAIAYTLQIYFDFSAYSDMAIGIGHMFGFHFAENFNYPYIARSVTEFWKRWHISLSSWFRDYVYIPLGGNRRGTAVQLRNLFIVWFLTGLWHGASWNYVLWGLWFFPFCVLEKYCLGNKKLPGILGWAFTMLVFSCSLVLFRAPDVREALHYFGSMLGFGHGITVASAIYYLREYWIEWIFCILAAMPIKPFLQQKLQGHRLLCQVAPMVLALILLGLSYIKLVTGSFNPFIYFQF